MAKIHIDRAYIEPCGEEDLFEILIHIKDENNHIFAGKVELDRPPIWLYTENLKNGDLHINNSPGMEDKKWDYITEEILGAE
jgi:hypothetical protein